LKVQMIVCDEAFFIEEDKTYRLGRVINKMRIPVIPYIVRINLFVKITEMPAEQAIYLFTQVENPKKRLNYASSSVAIYNRRNNEMVPGADFNMTFPLLIDAAGNYKIKAIIDEELFSEYTFFVEVDGIKD